MKNAKRPFHAIIPQSLFVFHLRNDVPPKKGDLSNVAALTKDLRGTTVVVMIIDGKQGSFVTWGIGRCEWGYQFNKKLARSVAIGRAKQAFVKDAEDMKWYEQGIEPFPGVGPEKDAMYTFSREMARRLIAKINNRAEEMALLPINLLNRKSLT
jgi:hypothetical protein